MTPEEKMASRVLAIRKLTPPYDLEQLASTYGELEYLELPFGVDGITIGIGAATKPRILINSSAPATRRKFTLAHEIGHVVIPWHTGTIVSHLENREVDAAYNQMETEANRFAAELLMPSEWLRETFKAASSVEQYLRSVLTLAGASKEATFNKILRPLIQPVICVQVDSASRVLNSRRSQTAPYPPERNAEVGRDTFQTDCRFESFEIDGQFYMTWTFIGRDIREVDTRPWREVFTHILNDTGMQGYLQNMNGILAAAYGKNKALDEAEICGAVIRAFKKYEMYDVVTKHHLFEQFVIKRVRELKLRG